MRHATPPAPEQETPDTAEPAVEFINVPIERIETGPQIRTDIDPEGESIRKLSPDDPGTGMIPPLTVARNGDGYFLMIGGRRLAAARFLGLATLPVRVLPAIEKREDALSLQLIENLQREDLNPIDMAEGLRTFFRDRQGEVSPDEILNVLQTYGRDRNRLPEDVAFTVNAIVNIIGKSISSIKRLFAWLTLPDEIKEALRTGRIGLSQGYLFADELDKPELMQIFNARPLNFSRNLVICHSCESRNPVLSRSSGFPLSRE